MAFEYRYVIYDFHRDPEAQAELDALSADGWVMHTVNLNFTEVAVMWQREAPQERGGRQSGRPVVLDTGKPEARGL